jgi:ATP-dependent Clp protease ATP-binding subunit ClpA
MHASSFDPFRWDHLLRLQDCLADVILGQAEVIDGIADAVALRELEMAPPRGCRAAFLFVGPTGVGKTETALAIAKALYGAGRLVRIDCSEFSQPESLKVVLGDGVSSKGRLASTYDRAPAAVWLFDEIEKGCSEFKDLLLQITDAGQLTVASGQVLDFSNIYVIATSNLGTREILEKEHLRFTSLEKHVVRSLEEWLRPELLARFETPFVFRPLDWDVQKQIVRKRLDELVAWQFKRHGRQITYRNDTVEHLIAVGFSRRYGARHLIRIIDRLLGRAVLRELRTGRTGDGDIVPDGEGLRVIPVNSAP